MKEAWRKLYLRREVGIMPTVPRFMEGVTIMPGLPMIIEDRRITYFLF
jgi:hypothetical protein